MGVLGAVRVVLSETSLNRFSLIDTDSAKRLRKPTPSVSCGYASRDTLDCRGWRAVRRVAPSGLLPPEASIPQAEYVRKCRSLLRT